MRPAPNRTFAFLSVLFALACGDDPAVPVVMCEEGDTECVEPLDTVRLTYLDLQYDLSQPVYLNNRVPVEYGLTGSGEGITTQVAVSFSFVEAEPADPEAAIECSSNAAVVELPGDGAEHRFSGYIWPTTACEELLGKAVNISVEFDGGEEVENGSDAPRVAFTAANQDQPINQLCISATGEPGCVYDIDLQPTPSAGGDTLIDIVHAAMNPASSVGVLPLELAPTLAIESVLTVNGRDPYIAAVSAEEVPEDLIEDEPGIVEDLQFGLSAAEAAAVVGMPGNAVLRYSIRPVGSSDDYMPLTVAVEGSSERLEAAPVEHVLPGTPNLFAHELFAEDDTRVALSEGGAWAADSDFEVQGCFEADFEQAGNEGSYDAAGDCRLTEIVLVREDADTSAALAHEFNAGFSRSVGGGRLSLEAGVQTENRLDRNGASSSVEGNVTINGNIGRRFGIDIARASAGASVGPDPAMNGYEVEVAAFNEVVFEVSDTGGEITREDEFSVGKSFSFPNLGFGFGPVRIGIEFSLGGEVGIAFEDVLRTTTDADSCAEIVGDGTFAACGQIARTTTPFFALTGRVFGGVRIGPVSGGVEADLRIVNTEFPLETGLGFGLGDDGAFSVVGGANWDLNLRLIQGDVSIVGRIRFRRRFLRRFNRTLRVNLFSFSSPLIERNLLSRSIELELLQ